MFIAVTWFSAAFAYFLVVNQSKNVNNANEIVAKARTAVEIVSQSFPSRGSWIKVVFSKVAFCIVAFMMVGVAISYSILLGYFQRLTRKSLWKNSVYYLIKKELFYMRNGAKYSLDLTHHDRSVPSDAHCAVTNGKRYQLAPSYHFVLSATILISLL